MWGGTKLEWSQLKFKTTIMDMPREPVGKFNIMNYEWRDAREQKHSNKNEEWYRHAC
jgi:hypothetical protein